MPAKCLRLYALLLILAALPLAFPLIVRAQQPQGRQNQEKSKEKFEKDFENGEEGNFVRKRMDWFHDQRAYPHKRIPPGVRLKALQQLNVKLAAETAARAHGIPGKLQPQAQPPSGPPTWQELGPQPANSFGLVSSGRVAAVAVDPTNNEVVYAGAAQGGVWKTSDGGNTWTPLTDTQASLAIGSIAIDPENPLTIYVGTGEENNSGDSYYGAGILKSTDGGNTWTNYPGPFAGGANGGARIGGLVVHPKNSNVVLAAVGCCNPTLTSGVYRSADGGQTWTLTGNANNSQAYNVIFDSTGANAYASFDGNGVYKSNDGGVTWSADNGTGANALPTGGETERVALAMDPNASTTLYAGIAITPFNGGSGELYGLYKTTNGGTSWTLLTNTDYCLSQCWYDNVIAVAPGNSNVVFIGGAGWGDQIFQSLNAGETWTLIPPDESIHPDLHALAFTPDGTILYVGNDGGVYKITSPKSAVTSAEVTSLNAGSSPGAGLATLQFYAGPAIHPTNANQGVAGTQDNGTLAYSNSLTWGEANPDCGDGARNLIDFADPSTLYETCVELTILKSTDGGTTFNEAQSGIDPSGNDRINWVAPFTMDPGEHLNLYAGTNFVYQTTNGASSWRAISPDLTAGSASGDSLIALAVSPLSSNTVYAGSSDGLVHVTTNALSGSGATWTNITGSGSLPNRSITALAADPYSATTAYVTFSGFTGFGDNLGHVFKTINTGSTWTDISSDLPNTPVNDIIVDPTQAGTIYIATDVGVFYTTNSGASWATLVTGLPRVAVLGLAFQAQSHILWAATHGRSMWSLSLAGIENLPAISSLSPSTTAAGGPTFTLTVNGTSFTSTSVVEWNGSDLATTFVSGTELTATVPSTNIATAGTFQVTVVNPGVAPSNPEPFAVDNLVPSASSLSPTSATVGGAGLTLTVNGGSFVNGATVQWNNSSRATTFLSSTEVTATILATDIATAGTANVTVSNPSPGGGPSNAQTFTINNPAPSIATLSPASKTAGSATFTLVVNGSNFIKGASAVNWNGAALTTTFVTSAKLTASISSMLLTAAGTVPVTVVTQGPGGGRSNALTFTIDNLKPAISSTSPASATVGGAMFTLTVNGTNFINTSVVDWNGAPASTTFVSKTELTALITAADIATPGTAKITVTSPAPGGGASAPKTFTIDNPVPSVISISPSSAIAGGSSFTLTVNGSNFFSTSKVRWNGVAQATKFVSSTQITAAITPADIKTAGTAQVTVFNPTPGGGTSSQEPFTIDNPVPALTKLAPSTASAGGAAFSLTVTGTKFNSSTVVNWNGSPRVTTYVSAATVKAAILSSDLTAAGTAQITAQNPSPGGGASNALTLTINP
jgi:photosystem II stability/assembly factor-like uncharacterized protein